MHQGRRLQDGFFALPLHEIYGQAVEFLVNARRERIERGRIAAGPCEKKLRRISDLRVHSHSGFRITRKDKVLHRSRIAVFALVSRMEFREKYFPTTFKEKAMQ